MADISLSELTLGIVSVKDPRFGAKGNGATNDTSAIQAAADYCFGSVASPHGISYTLNKVLLFPPGNYIITSPILFTKLQGCRIMGSGRFVTTIQNTAGGSVFVTNGAGYCHFEGMYLVATAGAFYVFDLDYDGTGGGAALQSNTFTDMFFGGGQFGTIIGRTGFMGSECLFLNCFWGANSVAGLYPANYNSLQHTVIGGNFQSCGIAIWVQIGSVNIISGVGFQVNTLDISNERSNEPMVVQGCRSESLNCVKGQSVLLYGFNHVPAGTPGNFVEVDGGRNVVQGCSSPGKIDVSSAANIGIRDSYFDDPNFLVAHGLWPYEGLATPARIEMENLLVGTSPIVLLPKRRVIGNGTTGAPVTYDYDVTAV